MTRTTCVYHRRVGSSHKEKIGARCAWSLSRTSLALLVSAPRCVATLCRNQLAEVFPEMMQTMDRIEKEQRLVRTEDLPGVNALHGFVSLIYNAEQLTKILGV